MSNLQLINFMIGISFLHWFGDGVLQTDKQAKGKSKNWSDLLAHTFTYSSVYFAASVIYFFVVPNIWILLFAPITLLFHTITDYFTSRLNSKLWAKGDVHNFFVSVLFDQFLHFVQLFYTFYYLTK